MFFLVTALTHTGLGFRLLCTVSIKSLARNVIDPEETLPTSYLIALAVSAHEKATEAKRMRDPRHSS